MKDYEAKGVFPWDVLREMGRNGYTGLRVPRKFGGLELSAVDAGIALEELAKAGDPNLTVNLGMAELLTKYGSAEQKEKWLPKIASGEAMLGVASTEPHAGSDATAIKTVAKRDGDGYVITGEKRYVDLPNLAAAFIITARTSDQPGARGISTFLLEMDRTGIEKYSLPHMGAKTLDFGGFALKDAKVPKSALVGEENKGFYQIMEVFDWMRVMVAVRCIGYAEASLEESIEYVKTRTAFGQPIGKFEAVQFRIAEDITQLEAAKWLAYKVLWMKDRGMGITKDAAMLKSWVPELCFRIINNALQNCGAIGYTQLLSHEKRLRTVRGYWLGDGSIDIMKMIIAREVLGKEFLPYK